MKACKYPLPVAEKLREFCSFVVSFETSRKLGTIYEKFDITHNPPNATIRGLCNLMNNRFASIGFEELHAQGHFLKAYINCELTKLNWYPLSYSQILHCLYKYEMFQDFFENSQTLTHHGYNRA